LLGLDTEASEFMDETIKLQNCKTTGQNGVLYSTDREIAQGTEFFVWENVVSSAWMYLLIRNPKVLFPHLPFLEITAPGIICPGTPVQFSVANAPAGISWDKSSNINIISSSNNSATVSATAAGTGWVGVYMGAVELARKTVQIGTPVGSISEAYDPVTNQIATTLFKDRTYRFYALNVPSGLGSGDIRWELIPPRFGLISLNMGYSPIIGFDVGPFPGGMSGTFTLRMTWNGSCGYSPWAEKQLIVV